MIDGPAAQAASNNVYSRRVNIFKTIPLASLGLLAACAAGPPQPQVTAELDAVAEVRSGEVLKASLRIENRGSEPRLVRAEDFRMIFEGMVQGSRLTQAQAGDEETNGMGLEQDEILLEGNQTVVIDVLDYGAERPMPFGPDNQVRIMNCHFEVEIVEMLPEEGIVLGTYHHASRSIQYSMLPYTD